MQRRPDVEVCWLCLTLLLFGLTATLQTLAATCSCAGVPLLNSLDSSSVEPGTLHMSLNWEYHEISDLVSGSDDLSDETDRERSSQSTLLQFNYGFSEHWSVAAMFSYVRHERQVGISQFGKQSSSGISDSVVLAKFTPIYITPFESNELAFGLGARIPTGDDSAGGDITLAEDMQPGTGAWAGMLWINYARTFDPAAKLQFLAISNYTWNGDNDRNYQFGHELNLSAGFGYQTEVDWGFSGLLHYRTTDADQRNEVEIPNTGGEWLYFVPALQYQLTTKTALKISGRLPVYRDLNGALQFTTSYAVSAGVSHVF